MWPQLYRLWRGSVGSDRGYMCSDRGSTSTWTRRRRIGWCSPGGLRRRLRRHVSLQFLLLLKRFNKCSFQSVGVLGLQGLLDVRRDTSLANHLHFFAWNQTGNLLVCIYRDYGLAKGSRAINGNKKILAWPIIPPSQPRVNQWLKFSWGLFNA